LPSRNWRISPQSALLHDLTNALALMLLAQPLTVGGPAREWKPSSSSKPSGACAATTQTTMATPTIARIAIPSTVSTTAIIFSLSDIQSNGGRSGASLSQDKYNRLPGCKPANSKSAD